MATRPMRMQREMSIEKLFGLTDPPPVRSLYRYDGLKGKIDVPRPVGGAVSVDAESGISGRIVNIPSEFLNFRELHVSDVHELQTQKRD